MPQLEQRWRPYPTASRRGLFLSRFLFTGLSVVASRWPLSWAILHLGAFALGGWFAGEFHQLILPLGDLSVNWLTRAAAVLPLGLAIGRYRIGILVWLAVGVLSFGSGFQESKFRAARPSVHADSPVEPSRPQVWNGAAVIRITGWPVPGGKRDTWRAPARFVEILTAELEDTQIRPARGDGIMLSGSGRSPDPGALLAGRFEVKIPPRSQVPGGFDYQCFLTGRGIDWKGKVTDSRAIGERDLISQLGQHALSPLRDYLLGLIRELLPPVEAGLAAAVLLGSRTPDSRAASRPFAELGLAHLFSVSGLHVGILLGIFLLPATRLSFSPGWRVLPLLVVLPIYVLLTGLPGSVVRAAGLGFLGLAASLVGRRADPMYLVGLLFWCGSLWDPIQNLDPGLRLSYLAAGGILAVGRRAEETEILGRGHGKFVGLGLLISLTAQWFTLPQVAVSFGRISLVSPLANLVAVPLFGLAIWAVVLAMALGAVFPWAGQALAGWAWLLMRSLAGAVQWGSQTSGGCGLGLAVPGPGRISLLILLSAVLLWLMTRRVGGPVIPMWFRRIGILGVFGLGFLVIAPRGADLLAVPGVTVWQLDVGQGDCCLLVFPDRWTCMIDTGGRFGRRADADGPLSRAVLPFLERGRVDRLGAVILTHDHLDHTGGAGALSRAVVVENYYCGGDAARVLQDVADPETIHEPQAGEVLHRWKEWSLEILFPIGPVPSDFSENNHSLVIGLRHKNTMIMVFSGDLELEGEALWALEGEIPKDVQVWKAAHHGSDTSGSSKMLNRMSPDLILVSCGVGNSYEHPSHGPYVVAGDTLAVLRTDLHGSVRLQWDERDRLRVTSWIPAREAGFLDTLDGGF